MMVPPPTALPTDTNAWFEIVMAPRRANARAYKPQPAAYLVSAAALGLAPAAVMMVAAHNGDLAAARALGLKTAFVPRPSEHGPGQTSDLAPESDWDVVASDFNDLARQMSE